jgi:hypothetical protein
MAVGEQRDVHKMHHKLHQEHPRISQLDDFVLMMTKLNVIHSHPSQIRIFSGYKQAAGPKYLRTPTRQTPPPHVP